MTTHRQQHTAAWVRHFADRGHPGARPLAAGVEGAVYRLGDGTIAKVWSGRRPTGLERMRRVYEDIARHAVSLPFATPEIHAVEEHEGVLVTYERELRGTPLRSDSAIVAPPRELPARETDALLTVLRALAAVPGTEAMRRLTVQGDDRPLWEGHARFPDALAALVRRAVRRHGDLLAAQVPELAAVVRRTTESLVALPDSPFVSVVHGDLVPPNIHVDDTGAPTAVLDFGFFTTAGDPAFEAAVTAAVWDMYGPYAEHHTAVLTRLFAEELRHSPDTLALYRRAYALATYDLFSTDGSDGHFRWCAALLGRGSLTPPR
ncbi:Predicted kinase, aminoglycoside phosphotransferase (APT) family [Streptomyces sp. 3213]|uniref:phosphotransferase family protein n=1 Tax=Streptomyces sp. 3213.3 TaxID=1855348 RepID=UPI00089BA759|nr:aminoglycoside phosphotransferase family protein [Streptomyces sp. 3213.3]SEE04464.1 Predicted kinase, aminoglycoside phosphotransferase (APT) family [Streptomyces sp. 3213] [Streptomyces sp. 3213.3]